MLDRVLGLVSLVPFAIGSMVAPAAGPSSVDLTFQDPAIVESSGLVVRDGLFLTTNDSGDGGRIFVVDGSGRTVGSTSWEPAPKDVEALAPASPGWVWVGDIGDNVEDRETVTVLKVPFGRETQEVEPESYTLVYPDHPHDAETLLADPTTGQLFVVTKNIFGGTVFAAPRKLSATEPNELREVADSAKGVATDGSFFPDGRHYVVRDYISATVYSFPGHEPIDSFPLPAQQQGEGIAVDEDDGVHVSTEGQFTPVRSVRLPTTLQRAMRPEPAVHHPPAPPVESTSSDEPVWPWLLIGAAGAAFVLLVLRKLTPRGAPP
jgi:hypothetical protein